MITYANVNLFDLISFLALRPYLLVKDLKNQTVECIGAWSLVD